MLGGEAYLSSGYADGCSYLSDAENVVWRTLGKNSMKFVLWILRGLVLCFVCRKPVNAGGLRV